MILISSCSFIKLVSLSCLLSFTINSYKRFNSLTSFYVRPTSLSYTSITLQSQQINYNANLIPRHRDSTNSNKVEKILRSHIVASKVTEATSILSSLNSSILDTGRNVIYVVCETCRRSNQVHLITSFLQAIPQHVFSCTEDDVIPLLCEYVDKGNMKAVQPVIAYMNARNVVFSAKAFSIMLKGKVTCHC